MNEVFPFLYLLATSLLTQVRTGLCCHKGTALVLSTLLPQTFRSLFTRVRSWQLSPSLCCHLGYCVPKDLASAFFRFLKVSVSPPLQPIKVPMSSQQKPQPTHPSTLLWDEWTWQKPFLLSPRLPNATCHQPQQRGSAPVTTSSSPVGCWSDRGSRA